MAKRAHSSIGDVLNQLRDEFPDITISKIRFLESQGLVDPERTPSGYRKFYSGRRRTPALHPAPAARALPAAEGHQGTARRGRPRRRIRRAPTADDGAEPATGAPSIPATVDALFEETRRAAQSAEARSASAQVRDDDGPDDLAAAESGVSLTRAELARAAGITDEELGPARGVRAGRAQRRRPATACCSTTTRSRSRACAPAFMRHGIEPRHLRMYRAFAEREAGLFEQVLLPYRRQRNPEAQARTRETLGELAGLGRQLRTALLRQTVRRTFNELTCATATVLLDADARSPRHVRRGSAARSRATIPTASCSSAC